MLKKKNQLLCRCTNTAKYHVSVKTIKINFKNFDIKKMFECLPQQSNYIHEKNGIEISPILSTVSLFK